MKYTYYPGCTSGTTSVEFCLSTEAVCEALGVELLELEDWSCCGASSAHSLDHKLSLSLPGRNVALAQEAGLDIVIQMCLMQPAPPISAMSRACSGSNVQKSRLPPLWSQLDTRSRRTPYRRRAKSARDELPICMMGLPRNDL